jgi:hypothetical protein
MIPASGNVSGPFGEGKGTRCARTQHAQAPRKPLFVLIILFFSPVHQNVLLTKIVLYTRHPRSQGEVAHQTDHSRSPVPRECTVHCSKMAF